MIDFATPELGVTSKAALIAFAVACCFALVNVRRRSGVRAYHCVTLWLFVYAAALGLGNVATTVFAVSVVDIGSAGSWAALLYAAVGLGIFYGGLNNINVTYLDKGIIAIQDWSKLARDVAEKSALDRRSRAIDEIRRKMEEAHPEIPEEQLDAHLSKYCGGAETVKKVEHEARRIGGNPRRLKALELADCAPRRAASILKTLGKNRHAP